MKYEHFSSFSEISTPLLIQSVEHFGKQGDQMNNVDSEVEALFSNVPFLKTTFFKKDELKNPDKNVLTSTSGSAVPNVDCRSPTEYPSKPKQPQDVKQRTRRNARGSSERIRITYSSTQLLTLEEEYCRNKYIDRTRSVHLAEHLKLSEKQIKIWFQNRRMKTKQESKQKQEKLPIFSPVTSNSNHSTSPNTSVEELNDSAMYDYSFIKTKSKQHFSGASLYPDDFTHVRSNSPGTQTVSCRFPNNYFYPFNDLNFNEQLYFQDHGNPYSIHNLHDCEGESLFACNNGNVRNSSLMDIIHEFL